LTDIYGHHYVLLGDRDFANNRTQLIDVFVFGWVLLSGVVEENQYTYINGVFLKCMLKSGEKLCCME